MYRHTKNLCVGTLFADIDDDTGQEVVFRIVESRSGGTDDYIWYVPHYQFPDEDPPYEAGGAWEHSSFEEVKAWHAASRADLATRPDLQPPTCMQDTSKTLEIYNEALYPTMRRLVLRDVVEDNASPHNNDDI